MKLTTDSHSVPHLYSDMSTVAYMNNATLETLALFKGDTIICKGKKRKDTVLIVLTDENVEEGKIQMNKGTSNLLLSTLTGESGLTNLTLPPLDSREKQLESQAR